MGHWRLFGRGRGKGWGFRGLGLGSCRLCDGWGIGSSVRLVGAGVCMRWLGGEWGLLRGFGTRLLGILVSGLHTPLSALSALPLPAVALTQAAIYFHEYFVRAKRQFHF